MFRALAADDPPLHLVVGEHHHRDGGLRDVVGGGALDRHADDPLRLARGLLAGLVLDPLDDVGGLDPRLVLHHLDQLFLRLLGGQAGDLLELGALLVEHAAELGLALLHPLLAGGDRAVELGELLVAAGELLPPLVEAVFLLGEAALLDLELGTPLARYLLELAARLEELLARGHLGLAHLGLAVALGVLDDLVGLAMRGRQDALGLLAQRAPAEPEHEDRDGQGRQGHDNDCGVVHRLPLIYKGTRRDLEKAPRRGEVKGIPRVAVRARRLEPNAPGGCPLREPLASSYERGWHRPHE
jgi:hypothetical protein